jgi:23S rRNA (guanosine2251-2'-O)-methyltransferase
MIITTKHEIEEAILQGKSLARIVIAENKVLPGKFYVLLKQQQIPIQKLPGELLRAKYKVDTGMVAFAEETALLALDELLSRDKKNTYGRLLIADHIENPHNLGAMIRSCAAFDFDGVIVPDRRAAFISEGVSKSSSGAIFQVPIAKTHNLTLAINRLQKNDYWIVGTSLDAEETLQTIDLNRNIALIMGNEDRGIHQKMAEKCDYLIRIKMSSQIQSLNVSVAFGIVAHWLYLHNG